MGRIIRGVVDKILNGLGCKILAYDVMHKPVLIEKYEVTYCSKEEIFKNADIDIITLYCPLNDSNKNTINRQSIGWTMGQKSENELI